MKIKRTYMLTLAAIAIVTGTLVDTAPYLIALKELKQKTNIRVLAAHAEDQLADVQSVFACNSVLVKEDSKQIERTPEWRSCFLAAVTGIETAAGALVASQTATLWLTDHPDDAGIKTAAIAAIARGRNALHSNRAISDSLERVAAAQERSFIVRLLVRRQGSERGFESFAKELDQAEFGVLMPEVKRRQEQWRTETPVLSRAG